MDDSGFIKNFGGVLLSHIVSHAVPSALKILTSVFGMGTGVASSLSPPKNLALFLVFGVWYLVLGILFYPKTLNTKYYTLITNQIMST